VVFTGAAPLLDAIRSDYGLTTAQTGLLTTLPLLAFGLVSPLAAGLPAGSAWNAACCWRCC
jgi:CP family cyanate transporter-like MFS transporter